jgi:hypothetical protein
VSHSSYIRAVTLAALVTAPLSARAQEPVVDSNFTRTEAMIPMRDGTRLFTVILTPKQVAGPLPIIMSRTPYGTANWGGTFRFSLAFADMIRDGYVFVFQDIRGRFQSEGTFVMNRPPHDGPSGTDESTDTYDSIDWLIHHVPNNNGRVGILGISYPGWLAAIAGVNPHSALKAMSPQAPMGDTWMGDDFFHQGAFRQSYGLEYAWELEAVPGQSVTPAPGRYDTYEWYGSFPTLSALASAVGATSWPTWQRFVQHAAYDTEWRERSLAVTLPHTTVPTMVVGGWWDQEDEYGTLLNYATLARTDTARIVSLVMGPWNHGGWYSDSARVLGNLQFGRPTGVEYRTMQARWFAHWLRDASGGTLPAATVFDVGTDAWHTYDRWPAPHSERRHIYLGADGGLTVTAPTMVTASDRFVSDPAHPVPYRPRPVERTYAPGSRWSRWLSEDQRFVDDRSDVLTYQTAPLADDMTVAGNVVAHLFASTTGSDADWVVKLIDVYPDTVPDRPQMGGYELMVTADIMRGRYWKGFEKATPIPSNAVEPFTVDLHQQSYTFRKGHRIMVQVQSSWFPLYDRNPQTFVPNIFLARASDYRAETHTIYRSSRYPSNVELDVLAGN